MSESAIAEFSRQALLHIENCPVLGEPEWAHHLKGVKVLSRDGKHKGRATGGHYHCQLEGCPGVRIGVRWEDGTLTFPCSKGMLRQGKRWQIV